MNVNVKQFSFDYIVIQKTKQTLEHSDTEKVNSNS